MTTSLLTLFSAFCVLIHGSLLAVWSTIIMMLLLSAISTNKHSSILLNLLLSIYSIGGSMVFIIRKAIISRKQRKQNLSFFKYLAIVVPLLFSLIFFFIYKNANPLFEEYTKKINLDFLSPEWILFTILGFFVAYGLFNHQRIKRLDQFENNLQLNLYERDFPILKWNEKNAAIALFFLLNSMLLFINWLDLNYLYLGHGMPQGVTHKQFVHDGVGMLVLSITLGILLILFFFRGKLNFDPGNKLVKVFTYAWIIQNMFMVISTLVRHQWYVMDALLSYKRIGVYCWLMMSCIGLISTIIMIRQTKTAWYLLKINIASALLILVFSSSIDWDKFITDFNIGKMSDRANIASLDKHYMLSLSETNIAALYRLKEKEGFEVDSAYSFTPYNYYSSNKAWLDEKLYNFLKRHYQHDWRSYSFREQRVMEDIEQLNAENKLSSLRFEERYNFSLKPLLTINNIKELSFNSCLFENITELNWFENVERLYIENAFIQSLDSISEKNKLRTLSAIWNRLDNLSFLNRCPSLEEANFSNNNIISLNALDSLKQLKVLILNNNPLSDISHLAYMPNLRELSLNNNEQHFGAIPLMDSLVKLNLQKCGHSAAEALGTAREFPSLKQLDLSESIIKNINVLLYHEEHSKILHAKTPLLQKLDMFNCSLQELGHIELLSDLEELNINGNRLYYADGLAKLKNLQRLYVGDNMLYNVDFLSELSSLTGLDLSGNGLIKNFSVLKGLDQLYYLNLSRTGFNNLSELSCQKTLTHLDLRYCKPKTWKGIEAFSSLESISVSFIGEYDIELFKKLDKLKTITITYTEQHVIEKMKKELKEVTFIMPTAS